MTNQKQLSAIEAALQSFSEVLQQADVTRAAVSQAAQTLRNLVEANCVPDNVIHARLQRILDELKKYGGFSYLQIYGDGSMTVNAEALDGLRTIIANYKTIKDLLAADPGEWLSVEEVNGLWSIHKPTARAGDYRFPETWTFGSTKNTKLYPEKEVDMENYRAVFNAGRTARLEHLATGDNPYPDVSPAHVWWLLGWQAADEDAKRSAGVGLTPAYWDCECDTDYIHPHTEDRCPRCGALRIDQPWARIEEVTIIYG